MYIRGVRDDILPALNYVQEMEQKHNKTHVGEELAELKDAITPLCCPQPPNRRLAGSRFDVDHDATFT